MAGDDGEICSCWIGFSFSDALHHQWEVGGGSKQRWTGLCEAAADPARSDAATDQRSFCNPIGSDLVFQMHYTTNGKSVEDQSSVGLVFAKQPPTQRVLTLQLTNDHFVIPPGADNFRVEARGTLPNDATLLSFFPHMHLRGKRFEYNLIRHTPAQQTVGADAGGGARQLQIETLL